METGFETWNGAVAQAIAAVGTADFPGTIEAALKTIVDLDILMIFGYAGTGKPACLYHNIDPEREKTVVDAYVCGPYLLDPFYSAATDPQATGVKQLREMAPDQFYNSEYYRQHYALTKIRDEVGIVCRPGGGGSVVISFTRPKPKPAFGRRDIALIRAAEPVVRTLAEQHWCRDRRPAMAEPGAVADPINATLNRMTDGILTPREIEITSLILRGHSSGSISGILGIAEGTVKIHRKNLYQKLAISSQSELFSMFIVSLSKQ